MAFVVSTTLCAPENVRNCDGDGFAVSSVQLRKRTRRGRNGEGKKKTILNIDCDDVCAKLRGPTVVWSPGKLLFVVKKTVENYSFLIELQELDAYHSKAKKRTLFKRRHENADREFISHDYIVKFCISKIILSESILAFTSLSIPTYDPKDQLIPQQHIYFPHFLKSPKLLNLTQAGTICSFIPMNL